MKKCFKIDIDRKWELLEELRKCKHAAFNCKTVEELSCIIVKLSRVTEEILSYVPWRGKPKEGNTCQNNMQNQQPMKQSWKK